MLEEPVDLYLITRTWGGKRYQCYGWWPCGRVGVLGVRVWWCLGIPIGVYGG